MQAYMTIEEARQVERPKVTIGQHYTFYSDCVECRSDNGVLIRYYSGQPVYVMQWNNEDACTIEAARCALWIANNPDGEWEWEHSPQYKVRAANGDTFDAGESELNGWIFDTGQWVGPRVN